MRPSRSARTFGWSTAIVLTLAGTARGTTLLVPAYFYPDSGTEWSSLTTAAASGASITAILNPNSGPGTSADPEFTAAVKSFEAAGGTVVGYVPTNYTNRSIAAVEKDVNTYTSFYKVNGVFLDETTCDANASHLTYYTNLYSYIKKTDPGYTVIDNPGTTVPQAYAATADTLVTFEGTGPAYTATALSAGAASANIANEVPTASAMLADLAMARVAGVADVYFTDDGADGNPYDSLPTYFNAEVAAVATTAAPEPAVGPPLTLALAAVWAAGRRRRTPGRRA